MHDALPARLRRIVARAASPSERVTYSGFRPVASQATESRMHQWMELVCRSDAAAASALLAGRGTTIEKFRAALSDVEVVPGGALPAWADALEGLLTTPLGDVAPIHEFRVGEVVDPDILALTGVDPTTPWTHHRTYEPLLRVAAMGLRHVIEDSSSPVSPQAGRQMLGQLARRWKSASEPVLTHVLRPEDSLAGQPGPIGAMVVTVHFRHGGDVRTGWLSLLETYPALARALGVVFEHWQLHVTEQLARLASDTPLLESMLGMPLGCLAAYTGDISDCHRGGRTVSLMTFERGARVVYKPKDLRIAVAYQDIVRLLNEATDVDLPLRRILCRGSYTWEECIDATPCETSDEVRRFYHRMGMHARLAQVFDATDFSGDNVVAHGGYPVLVDLETFNPPRLRIPTTLSEVERETLRRAWDAPLRSALITAKVLGEPGRRPADVGALANPERRRAPFKQALLRPKLDGDIGAVDYGMFKPTSATPCLNGELIGITGHYDTVVDGYRAMDGALRHVAGALLAPEGPVARMHDVPVRFIYRDTHVYARLIAESLQPCCLIDGVARELRLERLWRAHIVSGAPTAIIRHEIDALRDLDIPLMTSDPGCAALTLDDGTTVPGALEGTALARAVERLEALRHSDDAAAADLVRTALFTLDPDITRRPPVPLTTCSATADWLLEAVAIGDALLDTGPGWVGLNYQPWLDAWFFGPLEDDLFSGAAGLSIALADLYHATGTRRYRDAARRIATRLLRWLREGGVDKTAPARARPFACGAFYGVGAWLYTCHRVAGSIDETELAEQAVAAVCALPWDTLADRCQSDFVTGIGGLCAAMRCAAHEHLLELGHHLVQTMVDRGYQDERSVKYPPGQKTLSAVPGVEGTGHAGPVLDALMTARGEPTLLAEALARTRTWAPQPRSSRELLECAEVAVTAYQVGGRSDDYQRAQRFGAELVARRRRNGCWFPEGMAADRYNLGIVSGVAAVTHLLLKLYRPDLYGSVRMVS
jgi:type 2 lantibiotic biosynthesis protein LanM